jgi:hypothetical protein
MGVYSKNQSTQVEHGAALLLILREYVEIPLLYSTGHIQSNTSTGQHNSNVYSKKNTQV